MWGQSWENILDLTIPYPGKNYLDVTPQMIKQVCTNFVNMLYILQYNITIKLLKEKI